MLAQVFQRLTVSEELCSELCPEEGAETPYFKPKIERKETPARSPFSGLSYKKTVLSYKQKGRIQTVLPFCYTRIFNIYMDLYMD